MSKITVWTRQSEKILAEIEKNGRYIVKKEYIQQKMEDHANLYFDVYHWYAQKGQHVVPKPEDALYPIWVSLTEATKLGVTEDTIFLELEVDMSDLIVINQEKWDYIVNHWYLPLDQKDEDEHEALLKKYQTHDSIAYQSPFFPTIKSTIIKSWDRIFEKNPIINDDMIGTLWEIRQEWIKNIYFYQP